MRAASRHVKPARPLTPTDSPACVWEGVDCVRCINLRDRPGRRTLAVAELARVGLAGPHVAFFDAVRSPRGGIIGCYESHRACISAAYADGHETLVILEDDVVFGPGWERVIGECIAFALAPGSDAELVHLGGSPTYIEHGVGRMWKGCFALGHGESKCNLYKPCYSHPRSLAKPSRT